MIIRRFTSGSVVGVLHDLYGAQLGLSCGVHARGMPGPERPPLHLAARESARWNQCHQLHAVYARQPDRLRPVGGLREPRVGIRTGPRLLSQGLYFASAVCVPTQISFVPYSFWIPQDLRFSQQSWLRSVPSSGLLVCSPVKIKWRFGGICHLHHQDWIVSRVRNQHEASWLCCLLLTDYLTCFSTLQTKLTTQLHIQAYRIRFYLNSIPNWTGPDSTWFSSAPVKRRDSASFS